MRGVHSHPVAMKVQIGQLTIERGTAVSDIVDSGLADGGDLDGGPDCSSARDCGLNQVIPFCSQAAVACVNGNCLTACLTQDSGMADQTTPASPEARSLATCETGGE